LPDRLTFRGDLKMITETYIVPEENLAGLSLAIEKLNKKAKKVGQEISLTIPAEPCEVKEYYRTDRDRQLDIKSILRYFEVTLTGEQPRYAGWSFCATLSALEDMVMIAAVPGIEMDPKWRTADPKHCDHCQTARYRRETFILRHEDGREVQVGRQCLRDFLGHADPHALAAWAEMLITAAGIGSAFEEGGLGGGMRRDPKWALKSVLAYTNAVIRVRGWVSRTNAALYDKPATSSAVRLLLEGPTDKWNQKEYDQLMKEVKAADIDDQRVADEVIAHFQEVLDRDDLNDYLYNLKVALTPGYAIPKTFGIVCSAVATYQRDIGERAERAAREAAGQVSAHQGQLKERLTLTNLKIVFQKAMDSQFGVTTLIKFTDEAGNVYTWFKSGSSCFEVGHVVSGKGTVKAHDEYKGTKNTVLTRCDLMRVS
jgi:hypothetical protein